MNAPDFESFKAAALGDGFDDVILGARGTNNNSGAAYVVYGNATATLPSLSNGTIAASAGFKITGGTNSELGHSVSGVGDINGDKKPDIVLSNDALGAFDGVLIGTGDREDPLDKGGVTGTRLGAVALNDYKVEMPLEDAVRHGAILALRLNDKPMSVRDKGPLFVVFNYDSAAELRSERYYNRSIWQLRRLQVD